MFYLFIVLLCITTFCSFLLLFNVLTRHIKKFEFLISCQCCIIGPTGTPCKDLWGFSEGEGIQQRSLETGERGGWGIYGHPRYSSYWWNHKLCSVYVPVTAMTTNVDFCHNFVILYSHCSYRIYFVFYNVLKLKTCLSGTEDNFCLLVFQCQSHLGALLS